MSSCSNRNANNTRSVTLAPFFLASSSLIPLVRSLVSERTAYCFKLVAVILSLNKIMPTCFYYAEKGLVCIAIIAPLSYQPFSYTKCTKLNIRSSCDVRLVSNAKYMFLVRLYTL